MTLTLANIRYLYIDELSHVVKLIKRGRGEKHVAALISGSDNLSFSSWHS